MTMTFTTAIAIYRGAVREKYPHGRRSNNPSNRRNISEATRKNGYQRGQGNGRGQGGGQRQQNRNGRRNDPRGGSRPRNHPDQETIILTNGQQIKYHPSYSFTPEEMRNMTNGQRDHLRRERHEYHKKNNLPQRMTNQQRDSQIQEIHSLISTLRSQREGSTPEVPEQIDADQSQSKISQVSIGSSGSAMGGRNRQRNQRNQRNISSLKVKRALSSMERHEDLTIQEPTAGTVADVEWDSNADTCCLGCNFVVLNFTQRLAEVYPYDDKMPSTTVPIVSGATAYDCPDTNETIILVVNEGLYYGRKLDHSLFNPNQIRAYGNPVWDNPFDKERPLGMELPEKFIPFQTKGVKVKFQTRAPTPQELENCKMIDLTSKMSWNPQQVQLSQVETLTNGNEYERSPTYEDPRSGAFDLRNLDPLLDIARWRQVQQIQQYDPRSLEIPTRKTFESSERHPRVTPEVLSERWGTLRATLQRGTRSAILPLARRYRADRMLERPILKGKFSTDTAYFKCKSLRGNIVSQIYFHKCGFYANYNLPKTDDANVGPTLLQFISEFGIPKNLTMDGAAVQIGRKTKFMETIRRADIDHHISGPYRPEQNPAEGGIRELKRRFYRLMTKHGIPMRLWDFVLDYVTDIMNVTINYSKYSDGRVPLEVITGITVDISEYLDFTIYGWVFFRTDVGLGTNEIGRWLGVSHRVGPLMTYWVLPKSGIPISTDTVQAIPEAEQATEAVKEQMEAWKEGTTRVLDAKSSHVIWKNKDEVPQHMLFDLETEDDDFLKNFNMVVNSENIGKGSEKGDEIGDDPNAPNYVGMELGIRRGTEGDLRRGTVKRQAIGQDARPIGNAHFNPLVDSRKYKVEFDDGTTEILSANLLAENILDQVDEHGHRHRLMEEIGGHRKTEEALKEVDSWYMTESGTKRRKKTTKGWEIYVIWKDGSSNYIPLREMKESFPIETAQYAMEHGLDKEPAFIWWVQYVLKRKTRVIQKIKSKYWERTHKYGIKIPKNIAEAIAIDHENENTLWQDSIKMEMANNRVAFEEFNGEIRNLVGYKQISGHMIFDVKLGENFRRKARYVADGHLTSAPSPSLTYSTVVGRDSVRILLLIAALNDLDIQAADIQNAFLTAPNLEKCYLIAGPEFLDEEGKVFIVRRALYGLKSAPQAFRKFLAQHIEDLGFFASEADPDVWMRPAIRADKTEYYEYIMCYVDDILCISMQSKEVMKQLESKFKFKKDIIAPPETYLGARVKKREVDGCWMWTISSVDYVKAAVKNVEEAIQSKPWKLPTNPPTPMVLSYEPELDGSPELNDEDRRYYQELIGMLRWATELGRVDILLEVSLLSQYQASPRDGHMEQALRIFSFLRRYSKLSLYMDWREPDLKLTGQVRSTKEEFGEYYRDAKEEMPRCMPEPRGEPVSTTAWVDASHAANKKTRKSHSGYVIFVNCAPIIWYSKRQNTVEASTFGSEFIAMKSCIEAITHLRYKLRMFGIPMTDEPTHVICDNESVVKNSTLVESTLNKKHNSIAYHYVRWNVAAGVVKTSWMPGDYNLADAFTKRLTHQRREYLFGGWTY